MQRIQGLHWTPISEGPRALEHILIIILKVLSIIMHIVLFHNIIFSGYKWSSHSKVLSNKDDIIYVPLNHHENSLCSTRKNYSCLWIKRFFLLKWRKIDFKNVMKFTLQKKVASKLFVSVKCTPGEGYTHISMQTVLRTKSTVNETICFFKSGKTVMDSGFKLLILSWCFQLSFFTQCVCFLKSEKDHLVPYLYSLKSHKSMEISSYNFFF